MTVYLIAGGGTAGHVNPMLATADEIRRRDPRSVVIMLGTVEGLESRLIPDAGYEFITIPKLPFPRLPDSRAVAFARGWRSAVARVESLIRDRAVDVVVGVGGYVSAPAYAAARRTRVPLVIHEANARPGLANRWAAGFAAGVGVAIQGTRLRRARWVGMPLRRDIAALDLDKRRPRARKSFGLDATRPTLLVTGGSLGARRINQAFAAAAEAVLAEGWQILQITGTRDAGTVAPAGAHHVVLDYCDRMTDALASASLVVSRAGSSTLAELTALGLPSVLVPYASGNGEQALNARPVVAAGGAILLRDAACDATWVREALPEILRDTHRLAGMGVAAASVGTRRGAENFVDLIGEALSQSPRLTA